MPYKGEDLDLRVPQQRMARETDPVAAPNGSPARGGRTVQASEPIWVDELVLQCCNYAFDLAVAHGAAEVGLEHLVHALTRVDAAALLLEANGVREGQLRRDSASLVASDLSTGRGSKGGAPLRSLDLETVLQRASDSAERRGRTASVDDVVWATLQHARNVPAVALLRRATPQWQQRPSGAVSSEATFETLDPGLADERRLFSQFLRDFRRDVGGRRGENSHDEPRDQSVVIESMRALEKAVHSGLGQGARNWAALTQRLQALEAVVAERGDQSDEAVLSRLSAIEEALEGRIQEGGNRWTALIDQLSTIEMLVKAPTSTAEPQHKALVERVSGLERTIRTGFGETARMSTELGERVGVVVAATQQRSPREAEALQKLSDRLKGIETLLGHRLEESASVGGQIIERVGAVETLISQQAGKLEAPIGAKLAELTQQLATRFTETTQQLHLTGERLVAVEEMTKTAVSANDTASQMRDRELQEMQDAIVRLAENQHTLASAVTDWRHAVTTDLGGINGRIDKLIELMIPAVPAAPASALSPAPPDERTRLPNALSAPSSTRASAADVAMDAGRRGVRSWLFGAREGDIVRRNRKREWLEAAKRRVAAARVRLLNRTQR